MSDDERMRGKQSGQDGRNEPEPGTMPEEFIGDGAGNRFGETPEPDEALDEEE